MAEAVNAFIIYDVVRTQDGYLGRQGLGSRASRGDEFVENAPGLSTRKSHIAEPQAFGGKSRRTIALAARPGEAAVDEGSGPIMRRASWLDDASKQDPSGAAEPAQGQEGFGLPRTPLRVLTRKSSLGRGQASRLPSERVRDVGREPGRDVGREVGRDLGRSRREHASNTGMQQPTSTVPQAAAAATAEDAVAEAARTAVAVAAAAAADAQGGWRHGLSMRQRVTPLPTSTGALGVTASTPATAGPGTGPAGPGGPSKQRSVKRRPSQRDVLQLLDAAHMGPAGRSARAHVVDDDTSEDDRVIPLGSVPADDDDEAGQGQASGWQDRRLGAPTLVSAGSGSAATAAARPLSARRSGTLAPLRPLSPVTSASASASTTRFALPPTLEIRASGDHARIAAWIPTPSPSSKAAPSPKLNPFLDSLSSPAVASTGPGGPPAGLPAAKRSSRSGARSGTQAGLSGGEEAAGDGEARLPGMAPAEEAEQAGQELRIRPTGAAATEVEWWLACNHEPGGSSSTLGPTGSGLRRRRHWQSPAGGEGRRLGNGGGSGKAVAAAWKGRLDVQLDTGAVHGLQRLPWYTTALDVWSTLDKYLPLFLPSRSRDAWDLLMLVVLLYTAIEIPLWLGFSYMRSFNEIIIVDLIVLIVFWVDIGVQFRTAYISRTGDLVRETRHIASHYCRTWLVVDLVSAMPWAEIMRAALGATSSNSTAASTVTLLRVLRLLKLARLLRVLDRLRWANVLRIVRLFCFMLLTAHWTACAWHGLYEWLSSWPWIFDRLAAAGEYSFLSHYSLAIYCSLMLVVGADNLTAVNNLERIFFIVMLFLGIVLYALVISNMALLAANLNSMAARHKLRGALAADALRYVGAPEEHQDRVAEYYDWLAQNEHPGPEADAFLTELPQGLLADIKWSLYSPTFHSLPLFAGCDEPFMAALQARLTLCTYTPGEVIFRMDEAGSHMYLVRQGAVLLTNWAHDVVRVVRSGEAFGELALLPDLAARRREATAVAGRPTDLVALAGRDLAAACRDHPLSGSLVQERLMQLLEDRLQGTEWTWFIDKVLVPYQLFGDVYDRRHNGAGTAGGAAHRHSYDNVSSFTSRRSSSNFSFTRPNSTSFSTGGGGATKPSAGTTTTAPQGPGSPPRRNVAFAAPSASSTGDGAEAPGGGGAGGGQAVEATDAPSPSVDPLPADGPAASTSGQAMEATAGGDVPQAVLSPARLDASWSGNEGLILSSTPAAPTTVPAAASSPAPPASAALAAAHGGDLASAPAAPANFDAALLSTAESLNIPDILSTGGGTGGGGFLTGLPPLLESPARTPAASRRGSGAGAGPPGPSVPPSLPRPGMPARNDSRGNSRRLARGMSDLLNSFMDAMPGQPLLARMRTISRNRLNAHADASSSSGGAPPQPPGAEPAAAAAAAVAGSGASGTWRRMDAQHASQYLHSVSNLHADPHHQPAVSSLQLPPSRRESGPGAAAGAAASRLGGGGSTSRPGTATAATRRSVRRHASRLGQQEWSAFASQEQHLLSEDGQQNPLLDTGGGGGGDADAAAVVAAVALLRPQLEGAADGDGGIPSFMLRRSRSIRHSGDGGRHPAAAAAAAAALLTGSSRRGGMPGRNSRDGPGGDLREAGSGGGAPVSGGGPRRSSFDVGARRRSLEEPVHRGLPGGNGGGAAAAAGGGLTPTASGGGGGSGADLVDLVPTSRLLGGGWVQASQRAHATAAADLQRAMSAASSAVSRGGGGGMATGSRPNSAAARRDPAAVVAAAHLQLQTAIAVLARAFGVPEGSPPPPPPPPPPTAQPPTSILAATPQPAPSGAEALLAAPASRTALLALVDAIVRQAGASAVPAVRDALAAERAAAAKAAAAATEEQLGGLLTGLASGVGTIEGTIASLDESLAAANRRLAAMERDAAAAEGEGVLAGMAPLRRFRRSRVGRSATGDGGGDGGPSDGEDPDGGDESDGDDDDVMLYDGEGSTEPGSEAERVGRAESGVSAVAPASARPASRRATNAGRTGDDSAPGIAGRLSRVASVRDMFAATDGDTSNASSGGSLRKGRGDRSKRWRARGAPPPGQHGGGGGSRGVSRKGTGLGLGSFANDEDASPAANGGGGGGRLSMAVESPLGSGVLPPPPTGANNARRRSLDAAGFSWLQQQLEMAALANGSTTSDGGAALPSEAAPAAAAGAEGAAGSPRPPTRRRSRSSVPQLMSSSQLDGVGETPGPLVGAGDGSAHGGSAYGGALGPEASGHRSRRASMRMLQAAAALDDPGPGGAPGAPPTAAAAAAAAASAAASAANRARRRSIVLDDYVAGGSNSAARHTTPSLAPSERPGARPGTSRHLTVQGSAVGGPQSPSFSAGQLGPQPSGGTASDLSQLVRSRSRLPAGDGLSFTGNLPLGSARGRRASTSLLPASSTLGSGNTAAAAAMAALVAGRGGGGGGSGSGYGSERRTTGGGSASRGASRGGSRRTTVGGTTGGGGGTTGGGESRAASRRASGTSGGDRTGDEKGSSASEGEEDGGRAGGGWPASAGRALLGPFWRAPSRPL
ncbi:hypothetical protein HYH03_014144 [Edaphochlamys debaryana]|uniref:Cyclic nucleotide-binding domain-containing protein n=1 Tax=Edaphochlamys debaryana TaxID=47281 RepID=A0A835XPK6_9CHLO|nr:hypothetical protein HYH03_014144 [Edaphochlamys debaryana]|eukprot:KAG2487305.1 hypothetical protein HYH03_014144 [Edaphochlamys debaryana]